MRCSPESCKLEKLMRERKRLGNILLNLDMYDRWGHGSDSKMNTELQKWSDYQKQHDHVSTRIEKAVADAAPEAIEQWCDAHIELLETYIETMRKNEKQNSTHIYVAKEEKTGWKKVRREKSGYVQQNVFYVHYDPQLYRRFFGFEP